MIEKQKIKKTIRLIIICFLLLFFSYILYQGFESIIRKIEEKGNGGATIINNTKGEVNIQNIYDKLVSIESRLSTIENQIKDMNRTNFQLKGFKDELFGNRGILEIKLNGAWKLIDYSQKVYVENRDKVDGEVVEDKYIDLKVKDHISLENIELEKGKKFNYYELKDKSQKDEEKQVVVMYLHGHGGNKAQGMNDVIFGGNFNRLKNLMLENSGVYITTDVDLGSNESLVNHILLIEKLRGQYSNSKIIIAGASNGGVFLWDLINSSRINKFIDGGIFLGTILDKSHGSRGYNFMIQNGIPLYIGHGTHDFNPYQEKEKFIEIFNEQGGFGQVEIFNGGVHGTPIRMIDWKETINWILKNTR